MSTGVRFMAIDPGFASIGWAIFDLSRDGVSVLAVGLVETKKATKKTKTLAAHDNWKRAHEIARQLSNLMVSYRVRAIAAEYMSFPRNASAAAKVALTWGVLAALTLWHAPMPMLQVSPQETKLETTGSRSASKTDVGAAMDAMFLGLSALRANAAPVSKHEHINDAVAVGVAVLGSEEIGIMKSMLEER